MRRLLLLVVLLFAVSGAAEEVVRTVAATGELKLLNAEQRDWLRSFESRALASVAPESEAGSHAAAWLEESAASARTVGFAGTARYLLTAAKFVRTQATAEELEKAWRDALDGPLVVILRFDGRKLSDVTICTCDPARGRAIDAAVARFERGMPGFVPAWLDKSPTRGLSRIANLHFRAGRFADTASTGSYLPFDRSLNAKVGRTWIVYENMIRANWWGEGLRPIALRVLPDAASKVTAEATVLWYGRRVPLYDAGPNIAASERQRLGASRDPISIMKGDLLPVLLAGRDDSSVATSITAAIYALLDVSRGNAPPAHRPAAAAELNFLAERGGLQFDERSVTWRVDFNRCRIAIADLASQVLAIERGGDASRADALFARYGSVTPAIERTLDAVNALPSVRVRPLFVE